MFRQWRLALAMALAPAAAQAQDSIFSPEVFHGVADVRLGQAPGEPGWTEGGFGKTALDDDLELEIPRAALVWSPRLGFSLIGHVTAQYQEDSNPELDISEAFLAWRAPPSGFGRLSAKAGLFYPPVSLEHTGTAWTTPDMLSASAINTWIGEEVVVGGLELTLRREFGAHELSATGAAFGWNDTSGTLLSFRGWALHGLTTGVKTEWPLPPLSPFMTPRQAPTTIPVLELDNRAGWYGKLEWRPPAPVAVSALYYDNAGNRVAVERGQWAWETRFVNLGVRWEPDARTTVLAQAMTGETLMGFRRWGSVWVDVGYSAAYVLVRRGVGEADALTGRLDWFETEDRTLVQLDDNREQGWAATMAYRRRLHDHMDLILEAQHVSSDRAARAYGAVRPGQDQTGLSAALRFSF